MGHQARSVRQLLAGFDQCVTVASVGSNDASRLCETRFGVDVAPVLRYQVFDARSGRRFLAGFRREDHVTIQSDVAALQ